MDIPVSPQLVDGCWFSLPPGYHDIDPNSLEHLRVQLEQELPLVHDDPSVAMQRLRETGALLRLLDELYEAGTMHAAFGLHTGLEGELCVSVLTLSDVATGAPNPTLAAARCSIDLATGEFGVVVDRRQIDHSSGRPAALTARMLPQFPAHLLAATGIETRAPDVFQARLAVARPYGSRVVVIDLTTCATNMATEYTDILLGIGQTVSFVDPASEPALPPSRLLEVLL
ncbi:hypothetical protein ACFU5O_06690 [Streptomyces sp. NPDC057445]|uniref:hypothetical protein n=1 Tax=Streptomyces sp. NPDC057445 TaxID=3346136 RepID=UPI003685FDBF